jgi:hypothetical protein
LCLCSCFLSNLTRCKNLEYAHLITPGTQAPPFFMHSNKCSRIYTESWEHRGEQDKWASCFWGVRSRVGKNRS